MILLRRFLVLIALFFWQGGFTFYASVVVPVGQIVFGHLRQGFVTQQVTVFMNLSGAVAMTVLLWDLLAARDPSRIRRWSRYALWVSMILALVWLYRVHGQLDMFLVRKGFLNLDAEAFRPLHRLYLWISTVQWACGLLYLFVTLVAWQREDRQAADSVSAKTAEVSVTEEEKKVPPLATSASPSHRGSHTAEQIIS